MRYIIIEHRTETSHIRAEKINRELYKISRPNWSPDDVTKYFLPCYQNADYSCFQFEDTDFLPVHADLDITALKTLLSEDADTNELNNLEAYVKGKKGDKIFFKDIIPSLITIYTRAEMEALGWFQEEVI